MKTYNAKNTNSFSKRLQKLIDVKKLSQVDVASKLNVSQSRISNWLAGKVETPRRSTLQKLSDFFGCDIDWLADGTGDPFPKAQETTAGNRPPIMSQQDKSLTIKEIVSMVLEIYESDTEYKPAMEASIRAFHSAVKLENEMNDVQQNMGAMNKRMERVEQLLISLKETSTEKRDTGT